MRRTDMKNRQDMDGLRHNLDDTQIPRTPIPGRSHFQIGIVSKNNLLWLRHLTKSKTPPNSYIDLTYYGQYYGLLLG